MTANDLLNESIKGLRTLLSDSEFAVSCSDAEEFCHILSEEGILCTVLSKLSDGRISDDDSSYTVVNSDFIARRNLDVFRTQCQEEFGLNKDEVFEPDDLLQMGNPEKVVSTIHKLVCRPDAVTPTPKRRQSTTSVGKSIMENVIKEICDHESSLVDKLTRLLLYRTHLLSLLSEWSEDFVKVVFSHTEQLYIVHREFHAKLVVLADQGCEQFCTQLSTLFQEMAPKLEVYKEYFSHLPVANARMEEEFNRAPGLKIQLNLLERYFNNGQCGLTFRALFDAPIRQTTSYLLLYKRLEEAAAKEKPDLASLVSEATAGMADLLDRANEYKRQAEQLSVTKRILGQISDLPNDLSDPAVIGLHLADDCFRVKTVKDRKVESQACDCLLTTKQLIFSTKSQKKESMSMFAFHIPVVDILEVTKNDKSFCLEIIQESGDRVVVESTKRKNETLAKWKKVLDETRAENKPLGWNSEGHRFELKTLPEGTTCTKCKLVLPGSYLQGYSCSHCDQVLHRRCFSQGSRRSSAPNFPTASPVMHSATECYHKQIDRKRADDILATSKIGSFLIRDNRNGGKALSILTDKKIEHINIIEKAGKVALGNDICWFDDLDALINYYRENNLRIHFSGINCCLSNGVPSRAVRRFVPRYATVDESAPNLEA